MEKFLKNFDLISQEAHLYIQEKKRFKNGLGGFITILLFFATSIMSIYLLVNYFMDQRYYFSFQESIQNNPTLNVTNFPIMFSINDKDGNTLQNPEKLFNIVSKKHEIKFIKNNSKLQKLHLISFLNVTKCKNLNYLKNSYKGIEEALFEDKYCLDMSEDSSLINTKGQMENNTHISFEIAKCLNTSEKNNCLPNANEENFLEIDEITKEKIIDYVYETEGFYSLVNSYMNIFGRIVNKKNMIMICH